MQSLLAIELAVILRVGIIRLQKVDVCLSLLPESAALFCQHYDAFALNDRAHASSTVYTRVNGGSRIE